MSASSWLPLNRPFTATSTKEAASAPANANAHAAPALVRRRSLWGFDVQDWLLILVPAIWVLVVSIYGDHVPADQGFGWDGHIYGNWARTFYQDAVIWGRDVDGTPLDGYRVQRLLPCALVYVALRILYLPAEHGPVIAGFIVLNMLAVSGCAALWCLIARELRISVTGKWLGFCSLFINYMITKHTCAYPVLTDVPAYAFAMLMLYCYLKGRERLLGLTALVAAFTWPTSVCFAAVMFVFPRNPSSDARPSRAPWSLNTVAAGCVAAVVFWFVRNSAHNDPLLLNPSMPFSKQLLKLSIVIAVLYIGWGLAPLLNRRQIFALGDLFTGERARRACAAIAIFWAIKKVQQGIAPTPGAFTLPMLIELTAREAIVRPAVFLVSHVEWFGPLVVLGLFFWPRVCGVLHRYGTGITLCVAATILHSLNSQSRQLLDGYAMLLPFIVKAVDEFRPWRRGEVWFYGWLSLLVSCAWMPIDWENSLFMHYGQAMGEFGYELFAPTAAVVAAVLFVIAFVPYRIATAPGNVSEPDLSATTVRQDAAWRASGLTAIEGSVSVDSNSPAAAPVHDFAARAAS